MIFLLVAAVSTLLCGMHFKSVCPCNDFLSRRTTTAINGFFILLVFISHSFQYEVAGEGGGGLPWYDFSYNIIRKAMGQLVVAMFLFNSGFGVMESIKSKGESYVRSMPRRRLLTVLLNFDIAIIAFWVLNISLGTHVGFRRLLFSMICLDSLGNSNWYIFAILYCYLATFIGFRVFNRQRNALIAIGILIIGYVMVMHELKPSIWSNTVFAYITGLIVSCHKEDIYKIVSRNWGIAVAVLATMFLLIYFINCHVHMRGFAYNLLAMVFAGLIAALSMRFAIGNKVIDWCGRNLFPIYIYQRIPMMALAPIMGGGVLFTIYSFALTILIVLCYRFWKIQL